MYEYTGAIHIHSDYSDGTGRIEDIVKAAAETGLDYLIMTDHNTLKPKEDGYERWINGVMVIIGYEVNDMENKNHYIAIGVDEVIGSYQQMESGELGCKLSAKEYVKQVKEKGGIGFIAHPDEQRNNLKNQIAYPWTDWEMNDYSGIEIWNHMSEWVEGVNELNKLERIVHPLKSIVSPPAKTLLRWDEAAQSRHVTGIGGVDAHAFKQTIMGFFDIEIFSYKVLFKSIRTHILVNQQIKKNSRSSFQTDRLKVLDALRYGNCFVANHYRGNASGFRFYADKGGKTYSMGDTIRKINEEKIILTALVPRKCTIKIIHNSNTIHEVQDLSAALEVTSAGVYRVECWKDNKGWIFSNHIRVENLTGKNE